MDWSALLRPEIPWIEKFVRPFVVYVFLMLAFRVAGKRELGALTPFDLVVLLTISNVVQNAMIGNDSSLTGGLIGALALLTANGVVARLVLRFPGVERLLFGQPTKLVENGRVLTDNLRGEAMTWSELQRALREHELDPETDLPLIRCALLELDGKVSILRQTVR